MNLTQRVCSILFLSCFVLGCGQQQETNKLINEINAERVKAEKLVKQAESKRADAAEKSDGEREKLIEEAASLYGQVSELLTQSADKAEQVVMLNNPSWYKDYFTLESKWIRNLAKLAGSARQELLVRKSGDPSEAQLKSWKEDISRLHKENEELRKKIAEIESKHGQLL